MAQKKNGEQPPPRGFEFDSLASWLWEQLDIRIAVVSGLDLAAGDKAKEGMQVRDLALIVFGVRETAIIEALMVACFSLGVAIRPHG